jgi:hypothetical protein
MKNNYTIVEYNNVKYVVAETNRKIPFVFDYEYLDILPKVRYYYCGNNYLYYTENYKKKLLHHFILGYKGYKGLSIDHINRITTDNRKCNLRYADQATQNKNQSKRKRNVKLPEHCDINPDDIPTFIWYIRENGLHGDRWAVEIKGKYFWKTTSSKTLSTIDKFELAKEHLRILIETQPEILKEHSLNGKLSDEGDKLKYEYNEIIKLAGYS